jgi:hypothetical protein
LVGLYLFRRERCRWHNLQLQKSIKIPNVAVFARNYEQYLESAVDISSKKPEHFITFRESKTWKAAQVAVDNNKNHSIPIFFSPSGSDGMVKYKASLYSLLLYPKEGDDTTTRWLEFCPDETKDEGLWDGKVNTLYVIRKCVRLVKPFHMSSLIKVSDDTPISKDYIRSYVMVHEPTELFLGSYDLMPNEIGEPNRYH